MSYQQAELLLLTHSFLSASTHFLSVVSVGCDCIFLEVGLKNTWPAGRACAADCKASVALVVVSITLAVAGT